MLLCMVCTYAQVVRTRMCDTRSRMHWNMFSGLQTETLCVSMLLFGWFVCASGFVLSFRCAFVFVVHICASGARAHVGHA